MTAAQAFALAGLLVLVAIACVVTGVAMVWGTAWAFLSAGAAFAVVAAMMVRGLSRGP